MRHKNNGSEYVFAEIKSSPIITPTSFIQIFIEIPFGNKNRTKTALKQLHSFTIAPKFAIRDACQPISSKIIELTDPNCSAKKLIILLNKISCKNLGRVFIIDIVVEKIYLKLGEIN